MPLTELDLSDLRPGSVICIRVYLSNIYSYKSLGIIVPGETGQFQGFLRVCGFTSLLNKLCV